MTIKSEKLYLKGMNFHALHGVYEIERRIERLFIVDLELTLNLDPKAYSDDLSATLDYQAAYESVQAVMKESCELIETLAHRINEKILNSFEIVSEAKVSLVKTNPPIIADMENVTFELTSVR
jgi:7,8-dihydroneopterin aldolase/epimerase/oxygenase